MAFTDAVDTARGELAQIAQGVTKTMGDAATHTERAVLQDVLDFVGDVAANRELLGSNPETSFEAGLALLSEAERRLFMIRNVLESLKRGEDPRVTLRHYQDLGLLSTTTPIPETSPEILADVAAFQPPTARAALWAGKQLRRVVAVVAGLTVEAARSLPKLAHLKMGVVFVAGLPCPSFQFEAGNAQWDLGEIWQHVQNAYRSARA